jgi:intracellular sulfur oxidation DsrE/DsrF family protein
MNPRRSFLSRFGIAAAAMTFGSGKAMAQSGGAPTSAQSGAARASAEHDERWQPARDARDDWFDQIPGRHRLFFDTLTDSGLREARGFANNYYDGSKSGYGLEASDLAVVICLRHSATLFAYTDAFWAKYGPIMAESLKLADPKMTANPHRAQLEALNKRGVQFAVCEMASHRYAGMIARKVDGGDAEAIYKEMTASAIGNAHFVAAGIIAVNRAQERGYSIAFTG